MPCLMISASKYGRLDNPTNSGPSHFPNRTGQIICFLDRICYLPFPGSLVLQLFVSFPGMCLAWFLTFVPSETGTPASLKHHVFASDITITSYDLGSKYDIEMDPKCPSTMDPQGSHWKTPKTYTPEWFGNVHRYFRIYSSRPFLCNCL